MYLPSSSTAATSIMVDVWKLNSWITTSLLIALLDSESLILIHISMLYRLKLLK